MKESDNFWKGIRKGFWQNEKKAISKAVKFLGFIALLFLTIMVLGYHHDMKYSKPINELSAEENKKIFCLIEEASKRVLGEEIKSMNRNTFIADAGILSDKAKKKLSKKKMDPFEALVIIAKISNIKETKNKLSKAIYEWEYYKDDKCIIANCIIDIHKLNPYSSRVVIIPMKARVYKN